ncbi:MAG TPA: tetratricopeptide repeat protein [Spirochaetales bacterium]|nr:tetratricopeptide repeat protein [Spirochaetales bacterium]HRY56042.1 tetratricopeptide repeat protein [Spirochaetia bacterium]HRZ65892.1 tetratricopeptide repeat protein [Spirochaetia bacterium]
MDEALLNAARRYSARDWEGALEALRSVASTEENHLDLAYYLGLCYARLERWDEALLYLEQVVTGSPELLRIFQCRLSLAYAYTETSRYRLAEYELKRLLEAGFESAQVLSFLGYLAWAQGRADESIDWYGKALALDRENATALNGMGYLLINEGRDTARALVYCRKAVEKKPESPAYLDSLAWAYYRLGYQAEARDCIERALTLAPGAEEIREHARAIAAGEGGEPGPERPSMEDFA